LLNNRDAPGSHAAHETSAQDLKSMIGGHDVLVNERPWQDRLAERLPVVSDNMLLATIAVGFLALHILAGTMLLQAPEASPTTQQDTRPSLYD
jgi:hypothetical protein